ncbi:MAG: sugar transporter [Alphaproteobacteria bacterium CG_4_9_14_3_um_filter_47_13]|nr:MAG: sugar transporter [Alphaproteobacteria bacterium CG_4_9_14_3_um_filter_47_13]
MKKIITVFLAAFVFINFTFSHPVMAYNGAFIILPGDVLHINVWKEEGMDQEVLVLPDGTITFPLVGTLNVKNLSPASVQDIIRKSLVSYIPDAAVTVSVKMPLGHKVSVIGQVQKPGEIILNTRMGVMQILSQVGGLTPYADEDKIIVIRERLNGEKEKIAFPYHTISKGKELEKDINLLPGDIIVVPASGLF